MILDERGFSGFEDWAERASETLSKYGPVPSIISYKAWRAWAADILMLSGIANQKPPSPHTYSDWRAWVQDFNQVVS